MSDGFTKIGDVLKDIPFAQKQTQTKETSMSTNTITNGSDPIALIRATLQQPTPLDQILWKTQTINQKSGKATMVAYTDARLPRKILDEAIGIDAWETRFERDSKGTLFCYITLHFPNGRSITKGDCGVPSDFESEKGEVSDAFKRACFTWGICADLYDLDMHWVDCEKKANGEWKAPWNWKPPTSQQKAVQQMKNVVETEAEQRGVTAPVIAPVMDDGDEFEHHQDGDDGIPDFMKDDDFENPTEPQPTMGGHSNPQWMQGRNDSIGFGKNAQVAWKSIDESMLWWCVTKMNHISDKDQSNIPIQVDRKKKASMEIMFRVETSEWEGQGWWGTPKECPLKGSNLRDAMNTLVKDLS